jgi:hypothetical protein
LSARRGAAVALAIAAAGCGSPAKNVLSDAAALEGQGKLEEAAAKLEMGCALSPSAEPCPGSDAKACETWQKAAEKAVTEGRYRDAEKLFHRATLTADDAAKAKIRERIGKDDLVQGLRYERTVFLADKAQALAIMDEIAKKEAAPAAAKAKEWLAKERPALLTAAVMAACGPQHEGSCTKTWAALQASGGKGPEVDKAQAAAEAEERRVYPLRVQAEGFIPVFAGRYQKKKQRELDMSQCLTTFAGNGSSDPEGDCAQKVDGDTKPEDVYDQQKSQDTLFRRTLKQIADPALTEDLQSRAISAESSGNHIKQDIPKPKPAPKK